ncbi:hypothetical protein GCM10017714_24450 [Curtobacterium pusillum]|uniref:Secreted protein n=1 Tax=Curtobacterium pusillum TaxID=69373 RepID=A0ABX2MAE9_9MICO|nr:hypothetical protein [Curtobacterium pusillum]NUU15014.1 hypothetical protein [Curtobacterium pusillum]GLK32576.1 hypothetical protein GCM10017610_28610 [Curtobacterium pusillum]
MKKINALSAALVSAAVAASALVTAVPANAAASDNSAGVSIPPNVVVDDGFDPNGEVVVVGDDPGTLSGDCKDRAFAVVAVMSESLNGCSVIGWNASAQATYKWYKHQGNANPCIWGKSFNSKHAPTWTALDCGTGRTKNVPWGNVAGTKKMKGLTGAGWAGVQWQ